MVSPENTDHQAEREQRVHQRFAKFGLCAIIMIDMELRGVEGERGKQAVFIIKHGLAHLMLEPLPHGELFEPQPCHRLAPLFSLRPESQALGVAKVAGGRKP